MEQKERTMRTREQIITLYSQLATVYDINVSQTLKGGKYVDTPGSIKLKFFMEKTKHLNPGTVIKALNIFSNTKKGVPTPIDIFDIITEGFTKTEEGDGIAMAQTLWKVIQEYGSLAHLGAQNEREKREKLAEIKEKVGPIAWKYIERCGGWSQICRDASSTTNYNTWAAQVRDALKSEIRAVNDRVKRKVQNEASLDFTDAAQIGLDLGFNLSELPGISQKSKMLTRSKK